MERPRTSMAGQIVGRTLITVLAGMLLACLVHITVVLAIPKMATTTASVTLANANLPKFKFSDVSGMAAMSDALAGDRQFRLFACPFDLAAQPIAISSPVSDVFWTLAIFDNGSRNTYSLNDRLTASAGLELVLVNASQLARLREIGAQELEKRIVVELDFDQGFALFRVFEGGVGKEDALQSFVGSMQCNPFEPDPDTLAPEPGPADDNRV
ncbi:MAG: DUF1254 domain-containing protein [Pseudomonadota bacterium]